MLPNVKTTVLATAAAAMVAVSAAPALAWGKKEQGFVAGVATAVIVDQLIEGSRHRKQNPPPVYYAPQPAPPVYYTPKPAPVYVEPHRTSIYSTPAAAAFKNYSSAERRAIQRQLRAAGYYHGSIDGSFGPGTYNAITAYARDAGASGNMRTTGGAFAVYDGLLF